MGIKDPALKQDLGPKKYKQLVEKTNNFYDKHKAGKRDPKTGQYYNHIHYDNPNKKTSFGSSIATIECTGCKEVFSIKRSTVLIHCSRCDTMHSIKYDLNEGSVTVSGH